MRTKVYKMKDVTFSVKVNNLRDVFDYKRFSNVSPIYDDLRKLGYNTAESSTVMRKVFYWFIKDLFNDIINNGIIFVLPVLKNLGKESYIYIDYAPPWKKRKYKKIFMNYIHGHKFLVPVFSFSGNLKRSIKKKYCIFILGRYRKRLNEKIKSGFKYGNHQI